VLGYTVLAHLVDLPPQLGTLTGQSIHESRGPALALFVQLDLQDVRNGAAAVTLNFSSVSIECMHASIACLLLYEDYVWVSLGNAMKAKQSKAP
jgi:hypothetical protein